MVIKPLSSQKIIGLVVAYIVAEVTRVIRVKGFYTDRVFLLITSQSVIS